MKTSSAKNKVALDESRCQINVNNFVMPSQADQTKTAIPCVATSGAFKSR